jgi:predicted Zn-dependent protease
MIMPRLPFFGLLLLMLGCGAAVWVGQPGVDVSLDSAREIWADVLRDADDAGLQATRVSPAKEMQLGDELAAHANDLGAEDPAAAVYLQAVGDALVPHVNRTAIHYRFHVIQSPQINAFALPGGHIYVLSGMLDFLESEAELAAVLGHEMSHVDLRHCIERYQYALALKKVGAGSAGQMVELAHQLFALSYTQDEELEADAGGERLAIEGGYDPDAAPAVFARMQRKLGEATPAAATTPAGEIQQAVGQGIAAFFRTHPPSDQRSRQLSGMVASNRSKLAGRIVYKGVRNYRARVARSAQVFPEEQRVY